MSEIQPQIMLQRARQHARSQLAAIAKLDLQLNELIINYNALTVFFLDLLQRKQKKMENAFHLNQLYENIMEVQRQMEEITAQKVRLADSLRCAVRQDCREMDRMLQNCQQGQEYGEEEEEEEEDQSEGFGYGEAAEATFEQSRNQEYLELCICSALEKDSITPQELMIMCDGENCPKRWYHLKCVNYLDSPPKKNWLCTYCRMDAAYRREDYG